MNSVIKNSIALLTAVERHRSRSASKVSRTAKVFLTVFVNVAVVYVLVNARLDVAFLREGEYSDFEPEWCVALAALPCYTGVTCDDRSAAARAWSRFSSVGQSILLTMLLTVVLPHAYVAFMFGLKMCLRWRDRHYTCDYSLTRQKNQMCVCVPCLPLCCSHTHRRPSCVLVGCA